MNLIKPHYLYFYVEDNGYFTLLLLNSIFAQKAICSIHPVRVWTISNGWINFNNYTVWTYFLKVYDEVELIESLLPRHPEGKLSDSCMIYHIFNTSISLYICLSHSYCGMFALHVSDCQNHHISKYSYTLHYFSLVKASPYFKWHSTWYQASGDNVMKRCNVIHINHEST